MPNKDAAKKALRQTIKATRRNMLAKAEIASMRVKLRKLITAKDMEKAAEAAKMLAKKLDKAHARGIMKMNTVARLKSRFMTKLNSTRKA